MILSYYRGLYLESVFLLLMLINGLVSVYLGFKLKSIEGLIRLKRIGSAIAFSLLAAIFINGLTRIDLLLYIPWVFSYPLPVVLFFGKRLGLLWALVFSIFAVIIIIIGDVTPLNPADITILKINSITVLLCLVVIAFISEKIRVRVQDALVTAQENYKEAEKCQREANNELKREIDLRIQSGKALRQSESKYRALFEESPISLWEEDYSEIKNYLDSLPEEATGDLDSFFKRTPEALEKCSRMIKVLAVNKATLKLFEAEDKEKLLREMEIILQPSYKDFYRERLVSLYNKGNHSIETTGQISRKKDRQAHLLITCKIPTGYEKSWSKIFVSVHDLTERFNVEQEKKRIELQLQQAQKLQATSTLSGGIAHEFNNALAVIHGNLELIELDLKDDPDKVKSLIPVKSSVKRMARLTSQLLAYAQGGKYEPKVFSINDLIMETIKNEKPLHDPSINVKSEFSTDVPDVNGDKIQIRMVLESVLANAFESIEKDGELHITTFNDSIKNDFVEPHPLLQAGEYAVISIEDNGFGMDEDTCNRIFEPFFTTKIRGRGLGMSAAYGIVRSHGGSIYVKSKRHEGTHVKIYLPGFLQGKNLIPSTEKSPE